MSEMTIETAWPTVAKGFYAWKGRNPSSCEAVVLISAFGRAYGTDSDHELNIETIGLEFHEGPDAPSVYAFSEEISPMEIAEQYRKGVVDDMTLYVLAHVEVIK